MTVIDPYKLAELLDLKPVTHRALRGNEFKVFCPFHNDNDPSMSINLEKEVWQCFGACHTGGTVTQLAAQRLEVSNKEARQILTTAGIVSNTEHLIPRGCRKPPPYDPNPHPPFDKSLPKGIPILQPYRNLQPKLLHKFGIYYCTDDTYFDGDFDENNEPKTTKRHNRRVIIPIHNELGQLAGFQARATEEWHKPKYLFSHGTQAARLLYNYHQVSQYEYLYVVEGVFGALHFISFNIPNVVALMGSNLARKKQELLANHKLIICLDNDDAGNRCAGDIEDNHNLQTVMRFTVPPGIEHDQMGPRYFIKMKKKVLTLLK